MVKLQEEQNKCLYCVCNLAVSSCYIPYAADTLVGETVCVNACVRVCSLLKKALSFFRGSTVKARAPGISTRLSGWRRRPWSFHRWGWCTAGSGGSAGENRACWTLGGTGPSLPEPGQEKRHKHLLQRRRWRENFPSSALLPGCVSVCQTKG